MRFHSRSLNKCFPCTQIACRKSRATKRLAQSRWKLLRSPVERSWGQTRESVSVSARWAAFEPTSPSLLCGSTLMQENNSWARAHSFVLWPLPFRIFGDGSEKRTQKPVHRQLLTNPTVVPLTIWMQKPGQCIPTCGTYEDTLFSMHPDFLRLRWLERSSSPPNIHPARFYARSCAFSKMTLKNAFLGNHRNFLNISIHFYLLIPTWWLYDWYVATSLRSAWLVKIRSVLHS